MDLIEIDFQEIEENKEWISLLEKVAKKCFEVENLLDKKLYLSIILTNPEIIHKTNLEFRNVDKPTDVLSFPMFEKDEIPLIKEDYPETLGDIMISIPKVQEQAEEYGHSFERELAYMLVHGFYHLMGYDHMTDEEKKVMREKEENVLNQLNITREV